MMPAVSVIIPTFDRAQQVVQAIESVLSQSFTDYEILVIDDGSTDQTQTVVSAFRDRVIYISHPFNLGVSAARNTGIRRSRGPLVAFLDSDDMWRSEKLAAQVGFFERHPHALACQTGEIWIRNGRRVNPKKKHLKPSGDIFVPSLKRCLVSPSAIMLKRTLLDEVGLFDESLPACEDYDLWLRIGCRYPVYLITEPLAVKVGGGPDQLSALCKGLDRFRIKSLVNIIQRGVLSRDQREAAFEELAVKCRIYGEGCLKRGRIQEGVFYGHLTEKLREDPSLNFRGPFDVFAPLFPDTITSLARPMHFTPEKSEG